MLQRFFKTGNQDPIIQLGETGTHHCVITSGFPEKTGLKSKRPMSKWKPLTIGVPFKPSQLFVGRSAEIDNLLMMLVDGRKPVAVSATVEGLGGIGKTELVLQLIHHRDIQKTYNTIIWLDGAGPSSRSGRRLLLRSRLRYLPKDQQISFRKWNTNSASEGTP